MNDYSNGGCKERAILERELKRLKWELSLWNETTIVYLPQHYNTAFDAVSIAEGNLKRHKSSCDICKGGAK